MGRQIKDLTGKKFGKLAVIKFKHKNKSGAYWECKCDCGKICVTRLYSKKSCGCLRGNTSKYSNLVGKKFGRLTVIEFYKYKNKIKYWKCKCDCGKIKNIRGANLISLNTKSCGCYFKESVKNKLPRGLSSFNLLYHKYKSGAIIRNLSWELSEEQCKLLFENNCYYCNKKPSQIIKRKTCNGTFVYNGIDRLNNSEGYIIGNVVSCCKNCNIAKYTMSKKEFLKLIEKVYLHRIKNNAIKNYRTCIDYLNDKKKWKNNGKI
jgi:hypothetical protein